MRFSYDELENADLIIDCIYESGEPSGSDSDVISKLLSVRNRGGFRKRLTSECIPGKFAYVGLEVNTNKEEWPNEFDVSSGILKYYGDNNRPGNDLFQNSIQGNKLLKDVFSKLHSGESLEDIPPFFAFLKTGERRNLRFLGLAVPGNPNIRPGDDLKTIWRTINGERYVNYLSYFTILDTGDEPITRQWIDSLYDDNVNDDEYAPEAWKNFIENGREGIQALKAPIFCDYKHRNNGGVNELYYGVPGSGKSFEINKKLSDVNELQKERILFHPDYTYSDFVGQILPQIDNDQITYKFTPGPFTKIIEKAFHDPKNNYFLIIEEINRGNAPAIFGDVFQLLDRWHGSSENEDENDIYPEGTSEFAITNSDIANFMYRENEYNVYGNKFRIPSNLSIIGTMNTSDQNVFTLDTAFQRRWNMILIPNKIDDADNELLQDDYILDTGLSWKKFCLEVNEKIIKENINLSSSEDKRIGTYFIKKEDFDCTRGDLGDDDYKKLVEEKSKKFSEKVLKYLWDDAFKFSREKIFNTKDYPTLDLIIKEFNKDNELEKDRLKVFETNLYNKWIMEIETDSGEER